jgi:proteic killer suppression protein
MCLACLWGVAQRAKTQAKRAVNAFVFHHPPRTTSHKPGGKAAQSEQAVKSFYLRPDILLDMFRITYYVIRMIRSFADSGTKRFYGSGKISKFKGLDVESAEELLAVLDAAVSLKDISPLKSVGLHKLSGNRAGQWAISVNGPWRICFRFKDGDAFDVQIVDYHKG